MAVRSTPVDFQGSSFGFPPVRRREILAWCLYDFANSSFSVVITTVVFSRYFQQHVVQGDARLGALLWGTAVSVSMLLVALASPLLGAMADFVAGKRRGLLVFTALAVAGTTALWIVEPGDVGTGMVLFIVANVGFAGAFAFYNGFLPEISTDSNVGRISGIGFALGYIGGLACLAICLPLLWRPWNAQTLPGVRASFLVTAGFYAVFAVPIFLWLRERRTAEGRPGLLALSRIGLCRLRETFSHAARLKDMFRLLVAFVIYNDGIETVIYFSPVFASAVLGFSDAEVLILFAAVQAAAFVGAWGLASLTDRIGPLRMVAATLVVWAALTGWAYVVTEKGAFWVLAIVGGVVLGPCQAASRSAMSLLVPPGRNAEFFGLFAISGKVSAILGPSVFGWATYLLGGHRAGILSTLTFFLIGLAVLATVDLQRGRRAAREGAT